jgi:hypothetical protein
VKPNEETTLDEIMVAIWGKHNPPTEFMAEFNRRVLKALTPPYDPLFFERIAAIGGKLNLERGLDEQGRPLKPC